MFGINEMFEDVKYAFAVVKLYWQEKRMNVRRWKLNHGWYNFKIKTVK